MEINKDKEEYIFILFFAGKFGSFHRTSLAVNLGNCVYPNKVLVIDRPIDPLITLIRNKERYSQKLFRRIKESNVYLLTPWLFIHDQLLFKMPDWLKKFSFILFNQQIKTALNKLDTDKLKKIAWIMHPDLIDYLKYVPHDYIVYDSYDEFIVPKAVKGVEIREKELMKKADITIAVSKYLKENKEKLYPGKKIIHSSNAVDINLFFKQEYFVPEDLKKIPKPIIGFVGDITDKIDLNLVIYIAEKRPDLSFAFVGEISSGLKKELPDKIKNLYFLGRKAYHNLPDYTRYFDIGLIPYNLEINTAYIRSISPLKLYEYLCSGTYVVSTAIPEVVDFAGTKIGKTMVAVGHSKEEFLEKIEDFLKLEKKDLSRDEINSISWDNRLGYIINNMDL